MKYLCQQQVCIDLDARDHDRDGDIIKLHPGAAFQDELPHILPRRRLDPDVLVIAGEQDLALDGFCCGQLFLHRCQKAGIACGLPGQFQVALQRSQLVEDIVTGDA